MPCEHYKDALTEAAAIVATPVGELRAHLEICDSCRTAFVSEQALFFFIEEGLHANANAEVPPSLLPRVRLKLNEEHSPAHPWANARFVLTCAAALVFVFFMIRTFRPPRPVQKPLETAAKTEPSSSVPPPAQRQNPVPALRPNAHFVVHPQVAAVRHRGRDTSAATHPLEPEVLVPHDQELLVASYQEQWMSRKRAPLVAANADTTTLAPLQVEPIQIAELGVKLMAEEHGE